MEGGIAAHVKKLGHSLESIRVRALRTILAKLDLELTTVEELLDQPHLFYHLVRWIKSGNPVGIEDVLALIHRLIKKKRGIDLLLRYDPGLCELAKVIGPQGAELIQHLRKYCGTEYIEPVKDPELSVKSSLKSDASSSSRSSVKRTTNNNIKRCCFHEALGSSDLSASSLPWDGSKSSKSSDLSSDPSLEAIRSQLNSLSTNPTPISLQIDENRRSPLSSSSSTTNSNHIKEDAWPQIHWPSPTLAESDVKVLKTVSHSLRDRDQCREAINFLSTVVLQDFPPQIFLNDTAILQSLFRLAEDKTHHQDVLIRCLSEFNFSLLRFYHFFNDFASYSGLSSVSSPLTHCDSAPTGSNTVPNAPLNEASRGMTLGDYCGFVLEKIGPEVPGVLKLLAYCVPHPEEFWKANDDRCLILKQGIRIALSRFGTDLVKDKVVDPLRRLQAYIGLFLLLRTVIPRTSASIILPQEFQMIMYQSLLDPVLQILFPHILNFFRSYVDSFEIKNGIPYEEYFKLTESMDAGALFIRTISWTSVEDILDCFEASIAGLEFHQHYDMVNKFVELIMNQKIISKSQVQKVQDICLKLLSSPDVEVRRIVYESASSAISSFLSPHKSSKDNVPFPELHFVINKKVLWEVICYGVANTDSQIKDSSANILILILKSQMIVTITAWREIMSILIPLFPLLHAIADMNSDLGRAIVSSLDPDVAKGMKMSDLDILKGNIRLMMSKNDRTKEEGTARVIYLVDIQSHVGRHQSFNLSLDPGDCLTKAPANYEEGSLLRVLEVMKMGTEDVHVMKSAITQLSLMVEDSSLHILFLDNQGLDLALGFLKSSVDLPNSDSQHFFMHSVVTLKHIAETSMQVRLDFSRNLHFFTILLKGIFLYGDDWRILRDSSQLLCLIVFAEVIISKDGKLSFPHIFSTNVRLPFRTTYYGETSENVQPSLKSKMLRSSRVQESLGLRWWVASSNGPVEELLKDRNSTFTNTPALLPVCSRDVDSLTACCIYHNAKLHLENLSSAYSHSTAEDAIDSLTCFLDLSVVVGENRQLNDLPWENSFKRYLTTLPASGMDQVLLSQILRLLNKLLVVVPSQVQWVSRIVKDPSFGFNSLLSQLLVADMDETAKELSLEILTLVEISLGKVGSEEEWDFVVSSLVQCLSQSHNQQFYSIAIMDKLLKCLLRVTEMGLRIKTKSLWKLLNAFHCPTPNSCMGLTITRLTLLCLSNLLPLHPRINEIVRSANEIKWLWEMLNSSDVVVKAASLELLGTLCCDSLTTERILSQSTSVWDTSLQIVLNSKESNLAREQAVNLCNIVVLNSINKTFIKDCVDSELFKCIAGIASRVDFPKSSLSLWFPPNTSTKVSSGKSEGQKQPANNMTTPNLLNYSCNFCLNLMSRDHEQILGAIYSQGLSSQLFRQVSQWQSTRALCNPEKVAMYATICKLLVHCTSSQKSSMIECIPVMVWLLQDSSYCENIDKSDLVAQSIMLLSSIVAHNKESKILFTQEAIQTICSAIESPNEELKSSVISALPPLTPFLSADASVSIIRGIGNYNSNHRMLLSSILGCSNAATLAALECDLLAPLIQSLRETNVNLAIVPMDLPRSKKANATLNSLSIDFGLITNFLSGSLEAKELCASLGLADALHKLWAWCLLDHELLCSLLQVLVTFTADCPSAASSLVLTSNMIGVGQRKTPSSNSLLHATIGILSRDIYPSEVKARILELLSHACQALESRTVLVKSTIINEFLKFGRLKRSLAVDELEVPWMQFLVIFTYYNEGQSLIKNEAFFSQLMMYMANGRQVVKPFVMSIFRNITFNHNNKQKLIVCDRWLKLLASRTLELNGSPNELKDLALIVWYLVANIGGKKQVICKQ
ncbi:hypothetical protein GE061_017425 [Apolygus lucorum]|uniref:Rotatin N-terminal domain-containing protein n=1 Tax=Apolygus lucorum TaxID=248454 RepID=A0A8S9XDP0_APOLU|nr:hypothetical protein GE061_017425 [Apolygus lucorum]